MNTLGLRSTILAALAVAPLLASAPANADTVVYDGGSPDQGGTIYAESTFGWAVAMNFTLSSGVSSVNDANWWGGCYPSTACGSSPNFVLSFYQDSGAGPGTLITSFGVGGANQTATGKLIGPPGGQFDEYAYSATFAPVDLTPGTEYWFGITGTTGAGQFGVETTSNPPLGSSAYSYGIFSPSWSPLVETLAFQLTTVPESSTWAMMLLGFTGLGYAAYRKRPGTATA
jgi:hypothetical protein